MTGKTIVKFVAAAASALVAIASGQTIAHADSIAWSVPAAAGKPYAVNNSAAGLNFSTWTFSDNEVQNSHATLTQFWSVPITGLSTIAASLGSTTTVFQATGMNVTAFCEAGSHARLRLYNPSGGDFFTGNSISCAGSSGAFLGAVTPFTVGKPHTVNVEFELTHGSSAQAVSISIIE